MARKADHHFRGRASFRRKANIREPRSITLVVCEGETEQGYLEKVREHFSLTTAEVVIAEGNGSAPISVVAHAEKKSREAGSYDAIFCVFDRDGHESYTRARERIKMLCTRERRPLPIKEAVSVPCFEFCILCHFIRTTAPFNACAEVVGRIRQDHIEAYEKADESCLPDLMTRLETAVENAAWVETRAPETAFNPYTSVHHLIRHLANIANAS